MLSQVHVKKKVYQSVLETVTSWHQVDQVRLIHDISRHLETTLGQDTTTMAKDVTSKVFQQAYDATLEAFQQAYADKEPQALRTYRSDDVTGILRFEGVSLSLDDEKELLMQALMEKYG